MAQEPSVGLFPQRRPGQSPAEQTPLDFWVQPTPPHHRYHVQVSPVNIPRPLEDRAAQGKLEA